MEDGWGLATDGKVIFGSDGSSTLYHLDPQTLKGFSLLHLRAFFAELLNVLCLTELLPHVL